MLFKVFRPATVIAVDPDLLAPNLEDKSMREAAALPPVFITAWNDVPDRAQVGASISRLSRKHKTKPKGALSTAILPSISPNSAASSTL
ncbi:hypothetical protein ABNQ38_31515 [Azospirillum sp. A29]|uniref:hypothetical protein n=1 Tax=Azospirillum sp. A29 TaxID=3160606 RepID=UPI0036733F00